MKYFIMTTDDPAYNIALEEYCFKQLNEDEIFLLWVNRPSIIIGRHQNAVEEINGEYVREHNISVVRRISGGGAVYHDHGNLNYTIISSKKDEGASFDFKRFSKPVIAALARLGIEAECTGRNDIAIDGKKICGIAQAYYKGKLMHHGCLLFDVDLSVLAQALKVSKDKIESKGVKSVRARVTNIAAELKQPASLEQFEQLILEEMKLREPDFEPLELSCEDLSKIEALRDEKFGNWNWVYGAAPQYNVHRRRRFSAGTISSYIQVEGSVIKNIKIYGDFFGLLDVADVEQVLLECPHSYEQVLALLSELDLGQYFHGISAEEVATALCSV